MTESSALGLDECIKGLKGIKYYEFTLLVLYCVGSTSNFSIDSLNSSIIISSCIGIIL